MGIFVGVASAGSGQSVALKRCKVSMIDHLGIGANVKKKICQLRDSK